MRILVVSAHYPPNFISGGTLAPQRQAQGLRQLGHDVSVYAGWLGGDRAPLAAWTEADDDGMQVRWIVTTPWVDWSVEANFDNPAVTADFTSHLEAVHPDVVHLHSLQSLGAGLVSAAAESGASVVVTMHDFWWLCGRQFLVDRENSPCPLVVSCGDCPCEVNRPWLEARNSALATQLDRVEVVLAVSKVQADVLAANGVAPERLRVDENGVPTAPKSAFAARPGRYGSGSALRLSYAGGSHRLKGVHVLFEAAQQLADRGGWSLTAYGVEPFLREQSLDISGLPVEAAPPFDPAEIESAFANTDVLLVPSVMRETYSLVTREALTRRIPVVCTDSLGPEEVVKDGVNGLVVGAGDASALASAVERLLLEDGLVAHLREGCAAVPVRSMDDQIAGLDRLYRGLVTNSYQKGAEAATANARSLVSGRRRRGIRRVLFLAGIQGAPLRYRAQLPAEAMEMLGIHVQVRHYRDCQVPSLAAGADAVVVYRVPATPQVTEVLASVRRRGTPLFFDVDDLIFDPDLSAEIPALAILEQGEAEHWLEGVQRYRTTMELCDAFIGSTDMLCRHAETVVGIPSARFPNGVGTVLARASAAAVRRPRAPGPLRVGYLSGSNTHDHDWRMIEPVILELLEERQDLELWLGGPIHPSSALDAVRERVRPIPFLPWLEVPGLLRDLDLNLAPLAPGSRFNEGKSAIKWLEAALTVTPTVASPTEAFREAVDDGRTGLLAASSEQWAAALRSLLDDQPRRRRLAQAALRDALLRWSPHLQGRRYLEILETDWSGRRVERPPGGWQPLSHDEPLGMFSLEPYPPVPHPAVDAPSGHLLERSRTLSVRGAQSLRRDGLAVTGRKGWGKLQSAILRRRG